MESCPVEPEGVSLQAKVHISDFVQKDGPSFAKSNFAELALGTLL